MGMHAKDVSDWRASFSWLQPPPASSRRVVHSGCSLHLFPSSTCLLYHELKEEDVGAETEEDEMPVNL